MSDLLLEPEEDGVLIDAALPLTGPQGVIKLYEDKDWPVRLVEGADLFEGNCCILVPSDSSSLHPMNSYDIDYYYCRTTITVTVDAADPSPLLASLTAYAQMMAILILVKVCGKIDPKAGSVIDKIEPPQLFPCGASAFIAPGGGIYLLIDVAKIVLPLTLWMTFTSGEFSRSGYIVIKVGTN